MKETFNWLMQEESGQGMVEYGIIIALIAVVVIAAVKLLGTTINDKFKAINDEL